MRKTPSLAAGAAVVETCGVLSGVESGDPPLQATRPDNVPANKNKASDGRLCKLMD
jgi:hypothetical protein